MAGQGARVISLEEARRQREQRRQGAVAAPMVLMWYPVWYWMPIWTTT